MKPFLRNFVPTSFEDIPDATAKQYVKQCRTACTKRISPLSRQRMRRLSHEALSEGFRPDLL